MFFIFAISIIFAYQYGNADAYGRYVHISGVDHERVHNKFFGNKISEVFWNFLINIRKAWVEEDLLISKLNILDIILHLISNLKFVQLWIESTCMKKKSLRLWSSINHISEICWKGSWIPNKDANFWEK